MRTSNMAAGIWGLIFWLCSCTSEPASVPVSELPELPPVADPVQSARGEPAELRELTLVLSGELRGEIEPCGCPTLPFGGFERRKVLLDQLRGEGRPLIQVDAGEALLKGLVSERDDVELRAALLADLLEQVGLDVFVPGPTDLMVVGVEGLSELGLPVTSATWASAHGELLFPGWRVVEREGARVAVIGLSSQAEVPLVLDPVQATLAALEQLPEDLDLIIAVGNLRDQDALRVAAIEGLALMVNTPGERRDALRTQARVPVMEVSARGRYLSVVRMRLGSTAGQPLLLEQDRALQDLLLLENRASAGAGSTPELKAELLSRQEGLDNAGLNRAWMEDKPLGSELDAPDPGQVSALMAGFKAATVKHAAEVVSQPTGPRYATGAACVNCHSHQVAAWAVRPNHARAMEVLFLRGDQDNPECVGCHSTGFGEPGGFADLDKAALQKWGNVQCESCHGPLGGHPRGDASPAAITPQTCQGCHDPANSPDFDYERYRQAIVCPSDPE